MWRPTATPTARTEALAYLTATIRQPTLAARIAGEHQARPPLDLRDPAQREIVNFTFETPARHLRGAELFWLDPDLVRFVEVLAPEIPRDLTIGELVLPAATGFVLLATPLIIPDDVPDGATPIPNPVAGGLAATAIEAIGWGPIDGGTVICSYGRVDTPAGLATEMLGRCHWPTHEPLGGHDGEIGDGVQLERGYLAAIATLVSAIRMTTTVTHPVPRADARRAERAAVEPHVARTVRVVTLRGATRSAGDTEPETVRYSHRWLVRPHLRWQPFGPGRAHRRLTLIPGHIKGPAGAELLAPTERVTAIRPLRNAS